MNLDQIKHYAFQLNVKDFVHIKGGSNNSSTTMIITEDVDVI